VDNLGKTINFSGCPSGFAIGTSLRIIKYKRKIRYYTYMHRITCLFLYFIKCKHSYIHYIILCKILYIMLRRVYFYKAVYLMYSSIISFTLFMITYTSVLQALLAPYTQCLISKTIRGASVIGFSVCLFSIHCLFSVCLSHFL